MILFYTEGGHYLGLGNIFRSLSLASEIRRKGIEDIAFLTSSEEYARNVISKAGFPVMFSEKADLKGKIAGIRPEVLVIDYLGIDEAFVREARSNGRTRVAIIGNDSSANHFADIVVNAIIGTGFVNRSFRDEFGTLNLWGPKYLVLRDEFERIRGSYVWKGEIRNTVLLFGGSDQSDFTSKVLGKLLDADRHVTAVIGAGYRNQDDLKRVIDSACGKGSVEVLENISNVSEVYSKADFLFTSPGTALFEGMCVGIPAISYYQNESQEEVFGPFFTTARYESGTDVIADMERVYGDYDSYRKALDAIAVGEGRNEIIDSIAVLNR